MPYRGGEFVYEDDFNYAKPFAQGRAAALYRRGDADEAARVLMPHDREGANAYAQEGERRALRSAAQAYAGENYDEAARIFGERGNIQGVQASRTARTNQRFTRELQTANRYRAALRQIKAMAPEGQQAAYEQMLAQAEAEADNADGKAFIGRIREQIPQWGDQAFETLDNILLTTAQAYSSNSPGAYVENLIAQNKADLEERRVAATEANVEIAGRRADAAETTANAALARANGGGDEYRQLSPQEAQARGLDATKTWQISPKGQITAVGSIDPSMTDGQRVASASIARMVQAETILRTMPNQLPTAFADNAEGVPFVGRNLATALRNPGARGLDQASAQWAEAFLRATSGAAVTAGEIRNTERIFLPQPGDTTADLSRKAAARAEAMRSIRDNVPGQRAASSSAPAEGAVLQYDAEGRRVQ